MIAGIDLLFYLPEVLVQVVADDVFPESADCNGCPCLTPKVLCHDARALCTHVFRSNVCEAGKHICIYRPLEVPVVSSKKCLNITKT